jgi:hypothetical protein
MSAETMSGRKARAGSGGRWLLLASALFAICMVGLAIAGSVLAWSPVPFWDMWDGYLDFFLFQQAGDSSIWWFQQNEHRIVLAKVLFWLDLKWFGGTGVFLIICNYLLVACAALLFCRILRQLAGTVRATAGERAAMLFLTAWLFLWSQQENLTWAFQSQFFLAQLLPLCALYWLSQAQDGPLAGRHCMIATVFGLASMVAMANGILALPLMLVYAIVVRLGRFKIVFLAFFTVLGLSVFFYHYNMINGHAPIHKVLLENPLGVLAYSLRYLGGPFYYLARGASWGSQFALLAGLLLVAAALYRLWRELLSPRRGPALALLFFIAYIVMTALLTASGRVSIGPEQAFSSRYTTPAVMAWAALAVLYFPLLRERAKAWHGVSVLALVVLGASMLLLQLQALKPANETALFGKSVAALALAMGVQDRAQIMQVYPEPSRALALAARAVQKNVSIFGRYPLQGAAAGLGQPLQQSGARCDGGLSAVLPVVGDPAHVRIEGALHVPGSAQLPAFVRLVAVGKVVGYAVTGALVPGAPATQTGFTGYANAAALGGDLILQGEQPACFLPVHVPAPLFSAQLFAPSPQLSSLGSASVLAGNQWLGTDFYQSKFDGMRVYGSLIHGDADTGTISLRFKRGNRFFYRSGPTAGRQVIAVEGYPQLSMVMPAMPEWTQLGFDSAAVPAGDLVLRISDNGDGWGEWSAVALKSE